MRPAATPRPAPARPGDRAAVSEFAGLTCADVRLGAGAHVRRRGRGVRSASRRSDGRRGSAAQLADERYGSADDALFPGPKGNRLSRDAVRRHSSAALT